MSELIRTPLARYLAGARWRGYGKLDCFLFGADWIVSRGWPDPAADFRGTYASSAGALRYVRRAGGVLALASARCADVGLMQIGAHEALPGDVGVGRTDLTDWGDEPVCLIKAGDYWASLSRVGPVLSRAEILATWRV